MQWYYIVLIVVAAILLIAGCTFLIVYGVSVKNKKKINEEAKGYYTVIIDAVGGIENIIDVNSNVSRLTFVLKDNSLIKKEKLEGVGIFKTSSKVTLAIGNMASEYCQKIKEILSK